MARVLVVDDEPQLLRALRINLSARRYEVVTAADGAAALKAAASQPPDVVILDLGLPDLDGSEVIKGLRGWSQVPIIVLSGRADSSDKVEALDAGADDYVTKPFSMDELMARLRAALRRGDGATPEAVVPVGYYDVDLVARTVTRRQDAPEDPAAPEHARLTPTEWGVLELLLRHPGRLVSSRQLLAEVWGPQYHNETNYLRFYLAQLRRKLEPEPSRPRHLITEPGMGYRFQP
jgi:two-component system, OmpR family, KDP operon response regulator KdpE